jgi:NAD(P)-dependent dehydrogenase (short-subunit alcohol dehydrogenase family)
MAGRLEGKTGGGDGGRAGDRPRHRRGIRGGGRGGLRLRRQPWPSSKGLAGAETAALDVTSTEAMEDYALRIGRVDVLVNVAGFVHHGTISTARKTTGISPSTST